MRALAISAALIVSLAGAGRAFAQHAEFRLGGRDTPHAGVPFNLDLRVEGFDESPQPEAPKLEIPGADVAFVAAQPNVARNIQMVNGRVTQQETITWVMRWRVQPHKEGRLRIPSVTVSQGSKHASTDPAETEVDAIPITDSMKLTLALPDRPIFVGETVPVTLTWLFRNQPVEDPTWAIPVMTMDAFTVSGPPAGTQRKALTFPAGAKDLQLPYDVDEIDQGGTRYHRLVVTFYLAPRKVGKLDIPASSVIAAMQTGRADFFGNANSRLFRAVDAAHSLEVKALPETDKPANFAGAVGEQFSIDVTTSRSVVKLGEPVELAIRIKSNQRLDTLALGRIDGDGGLPKDKFVVPADPATGELSDDGKTKTFKVTAQLTGQANEIPAIGFSYFDPAKTAYQTIHSEPIALSVAGGSVVGAAQVVAAAPSAAGSAAPAAAPTDLSLVDAELALSSANQQADQPIRGGLLWLIIGVLYAIPLALYAARSWQLRTQSQREDAAEVRAARRRVEDLLDKAEAQPARELAGPLASALRELARLAGHDTTAALDDGGLLARLETESFSPGAASTPLSADLRSDAAGLLRRWAAEARRAPHTSAATRAAISLLVGFASLALGAGIAAAANPPAAPTPTAATTANRLDDGRAAYQEAMQQTASPTKRKAAFARAEAAFGDAVAALPDRPELLTDWGNAALGAGDVATATLAYRRALALDGENPRARHNLAWLRGQKAITFRPPSSSAADTLLFFHAWSRGHKLILGSAAFAIGILLLVPWAGRRGRGLAALSILPFAVWLAMLASVVLEDRHPDDAVVMQDVVLRAADSAGAPAALSQPLPRGVELTVLERRDTWTKVRIASGMAGWVPAGAVERVAP